MCRSSTPSPDLPDWFCGACALARRALSRTPKSLLDSKRGQAARRNRIALAKSIIHGFQTTPPDSPDRFRTVLVASMRSLDPSRRDYPRHHPLAPATRFASAAAGVELSICLRVPAGPRARERTREPSRRLPLPHPMTQPFQTIQTLRYRFINRADLLVQPNGRQMLDVGNNPMVQKRFQAIESALAA